MACYALMQAEITIYIAAQTMPLIRVMLQGRSSSTVSTRSRPAISPTSPSGKCKSPVIGLDNIQQSLPSVELVQLPSGRIVAATSEEGQAFKTSEAGRTVSQPRVAQGPGAATEANPRASEVAVDDEVHRIWAEMGLSRRAWSQSPSPQPERERDVSNIANTASTS